MTGTAKTLGLVVAVAVLAVLAVGCGGDDDGNADSEGGTTQEFSSGDVTATIEVEMDDFKFIPKNAKGPAGIDEVVTPNVGAVDHELQLYKTNEDPGSLEVDSATGKADTEPLGERLFETFAAPGETASAIADLGPGKYAMICNIAGHYEAGMWGSLTIK